MKIRVFVGVSNPDNTKGLEPLNTLYRSGGLTIQGSDEVMHIVLKDGRKVFIAGTLVGIRTSLNDIVPCGYSTSNLEELFRTNSIERCQDILEGRFILVVVGPSDECSICTDRFGRCDIYFRAMGGGTCFASDLSLLPGKLGEEGYDQVALAHTLTVFGFRPAKRQSFYRGVHRIGVGEMLHLKAGQFEVSKKKFQPIDSGAYDERELNQYADTLLEAIRIRGSRYGNVVYLSSGWDSTSILGCLVHLFGPRKVRAVIVRMLISEQSGVFNQFEIDRAQAVADYYGVHLDIVDLDERFEVPAVLERYTQILRSHNAPALNCLSHGTLAEFVARTTNGDEAVFAGEISDGAHNLGFAQFTTIFHPVLDFREYSDKMASYLFGPTFLDRMQKGDFHQDSIYRMLRARVGEDIFDDPKDSAKGDRTRQLLASFFLRGKRLPLWSIRNSRMLTEAGADSYSKEMENIYLAEASESANVDNLYSWYLHLYNSFHWQASTVAAMTLTAEANGFHLALPFWDSRIQEFLSGMPEYWGRGLDLNPTKYPLKWMLKNRIDYPYHLQKGPHSYLYDVNPSFVPAAEVLYGSALGPFFKKALGPRSYRELLSPDFFDLEYLDSLVDGYLGGMKNEGNDLNDLISLCILASIGWHQ